MRRIIDGKRYDTDTATQVCDCSPSGFYSGDFRREATHLYRTKRGGWFLAGEGGPLSRWAQPIGLNGACSGEGIIPLEPQEAQALLERHGTPQLVENYFAQVIEDA